MNIFALHISSNTGKLIAGIIGMLLSFHSNAHGIQSNIMQAQSMNIRLKPLKTLDDLQIQLSQSTLPVLSASTFNHILPLPLRIPYTSDQTTRLHIKPAHERLSRTYTMNIPDGISISAVLKVLKNEIDLIEVAEPRFSELVLFRPDDTYLVQQNFLNTIKAFEAWDIYAGDSSIVIGIIDNGFLQNHEDLKDNISINRSEIENNGIDDDQNGFMDDFRGVNLAWPNDGTPAGSTFLDYDGHGTTVAGVASATWNNAKGIAGVGAKCRFFPIKAGKEGSDRVEYGYEGILYGIMRGFPVLNCSWGSANSYSEINQSIIDFAVERNVLIVAGSGNDNNRAPVYPASYRGVMSVGETDVSDAKSMGSSWGWSTDIMAPGYNVRTTDNFDFTYTTMNGTSFAAPIIAGCVALVHGKYPSASMEVIEEHLKATADPIDLANTFLTGFLPGRVNIQRALQESPLERPYLKVDWSLDDVRRKAVGDTIQLKLFIKNISDRDAKMIVLRFSALETFFRPFKLLDTLRFINGIGIGTIDSSIVFRMIIEEKSDAEFYHSLKIFEDNGPLPTVLIPIRPIPVITDFESDHLAFSIGDFGSLGYVNDRTVGSAGNEQFDGLGFILKNHGSMLYDGGLVVGSSGNIITGFPNSSGFEPRVRFANSKEGAYTVLTDSLNPSGNRIGISIKQTIEKLAPNSVTFKFTLTNMNDSPIFNPGFGIFGDWDIGNYGRENRVERFVEAIPNHMLGRADAEISWRNGRFAGFPHPFVGILCFAPVNETSFKPQVAGMNASVFSGTDQEFTALLNAGNSIQYGASGDISMFCGAKFEKILLPGDSVISYIVIGSDTSRTLLKNHLQSAIEEVEGPVSIDEISEETGIIMSEDDIAIHFEICGDKNHAIQTFSLLNLQGRNVFNGLIGDGFVHIEKSLLTQGVYFLCLNGNNSSIMPFVLHR
ncbi:MAG: S8 family serine peptidase [Ignavibacteriae bacterium]|nr:S8 family serine peptidase [Ignavibacteriota bacterium]